MGAWASAQQVIDATGVTVTQAQLAQAQEDIEVFSNRIFADADRIRPRDLHWLSVAVARQAAWLAGQYGIETRLDSTAISQDGVSSQLTTHALVLAPMAARALHRCSWMRSRTVHVRAPIDRTGFGIHALLEASDEAQAWEPMP